jgi:hypothetical protein
MQVSISLDALLRDFLLYAILPAWVFFGFVDYLCHKASRIEETTGLRETALHALMGLQIGVPIFLGLFLEINPLIFLIMSVVLVTHEIVAHYDVKLAYPARVISVWEIHAHSFLEVIPFVIFGLVALLRWPAFLDFLSLRWERGFAFAPKARPVDSGFIFGYLLLMIALGFIPFIEEFFRCLRRRPA